METKNEGYKGYTITVIPKHKSNSSTFGIGITITKVIEGKLKDKFFGPDQLFGDEQEALNWGVQVGKDIIDGLVPNAIIDF